jgi:glycosyltransferase involved in cell wall biosynthesis
VIAQPPEPPAAAGHAVGYRGALVRILFFNEGNLGTHILGQGQLDAALMGPLAAVDGVDAHFAGLQPMGRLPRAAAIKTTPTLARAGLDLRTVRWHVVQALRTRGALRRELRAWPPDVLFVHSHSIALLPDRATRAVPTALSVDVTVDDWWGMPAWRPPHRHGHAAIQPSLVLERRALQRAALVLAWTGWARRGVERAAPRARVVEHHPGLDLDRYRPAARRPRDRPRILFVGGRFEQKGGADLLAALGDRLGRDVDLDLVTPADVAERPGVRVHRLGPTDPELLDLQQQADVLCLPTHGDAAPWVVLEALACGTPVVATDVGGIPDLLDDGRAGVLVPRGDRRALGAALHALLEDAERRAELAAAGRRRCEERYDANRQSARLVDLLRGIAGSRRV